MRQLIPPARGDGKSAERRWHPAAAAAAAAAVLSLTVCAAAAAAAQTVSAAGGYTVTATIEVGTGPDGVAVDATSHTAYVTNVDDDTVSVIDEATRTVTATVAVGGGPLTVAVDPTTHTAYVTNGGNGTVSVIGAGGAVTAVIAVGSGPDGVAVDPTTHTAYVANGGSGTVSVIDEATRTVTVSIAVGSDPDGVAVDSASRTVYVANGGSGTVSVIDEATRAVTATVPVGADPDGVAVDPASRTAYVVNAGSGTVSVIDEATRAVTATVPVGAAPSAVAVDTASHTAYVANLAGTVSVIDGVTGAVTATVPVGADPSGVAVDPASHTAYVANENSSTVSVISATKPDPVTTVTTMTSSRNPGTFGQRVTFTATVGPADGGTVTFGSGSKALCRAVSLTLVSGRTYHAACSTSTLSAGRDPIAAAYPGDAGYAASTGRLVQTIAQAPTALTARISLRRQPKFTLSATLTASGRPLSGQPVSFSIIGHTNRCAARTNPHGVASCVLTVPRTCLAERDKCVVRASYPGSASYRPSSATAPLLPRLPEASRRSTSASSAPRSGRTEDSARPITYC